MPHWKCPLCTVIKRAVKDLEGHICVEHMDWMRFKCIHCQATRRSQEEMLDHILAIHNSTNSEFIFVSNETKQRELDRLIAQASTLAQDEEQEQENTATSSSSSSSESSDSDSSSSSSSSSDSSTSAEDDSRESDSDSDEIQFVCERSAPRKDGYSTTFRKSQENSNTFHSYGQKLPPSTRPQRAYGYAPSTSSDTSCSVIEYALAVTEGKDLVQCLQRLHTQTPTTSSSVPHSHTSQRDSSSNAYNSSKHTAREDRDHRDRSRDADKRMDRIREQRKQREFEKSRDMKMEKDRGRAREEKRDRNSEILLHKPREKIPSPALLSCNAAKPFKRRASEDNLLGAAVASAIIATEQKVVDVVTIIDSDEAEADDVQTAPPPDRLAAKIDETSDDVPKSPKPYDITPDQCCKEPLTHDSTSKQEQQQQESASQTNEIVDKIDEIEVADINIKEGINCDIGDSNSGEASSVLPSNHTPVEQSIEPTESTMSRSPSSLTISHNHQTSSSALSFSPSQTGLADRSLRSTLAMSPSRRSAIGKDPVKKMPLDPLAYTATHNSNQRFKRLMSKSDKSTESKTDGEDTSIYTELLSDDEEEIETFSFGVEDEQEQEKHSAVKPVVLKVARRRRKKGSIRWSQKKVPASFRCKVCKRSCLSARNASGEDENVVDHVLKHISKAHKLYRYECTICLYGEPTYIRIVNHLNRKHSGYIIGRAINANECYSDKLEKIPLELLHETSFYCFGRKGYVIDRLSAAAKDKYPELGQEWKPEDYLHQDDIAQESVAEDGQKTKNNETQSETMNATPTSFDALFAEQPKSSSEAAAPVAVQRRAEGDSEQQVNADGEKRYEPMK